ncbi:C40 family peptidase [Corynebacterium epidermidicanis]|uniref:Cell wall-associated hydrolase, invasion-associated protein n=1 Tax=Corynebacterium epidermidicanis TaxID=1050174 RepID=A0A0G3GQR4_9CORY|nr:C40 family peptidase [Corynebacterium epidermidicanis]AKK03546.1 cell wall-associated hydrolase, invasion-associated protein [Corynebacterium epidermidicanis]
MGKHTRSTVSFGAKASATAVAVGSAVALATPANAAEVVVPNTNLRMELAGLENVPNIASVPGIQQWVPSLAAQGEVVSYNANVQQAAVPAEAAPQQTAGQAIVDAARSKIGSPYVYGAAGPNAFDCSGLTSWAYAQVGKQIPRTSYAQAAQGTPVSRDQLQAGDIVAFYGGASHVGIYTGHGTVIHALTEGTPLSEHPLDYMPYHSAVRF